MRPALLAVPVLLATIACGGVPVSVARGQHTAAFPREWGAAPPHVVEATASPAVAPPPAPAPAAPAAVAAQPPPPAAAPVAAVPQDAFRSGGSQPMAFALVVGIEHYRDLPPPTGARADAQRFAQLAQKSLGIPDANVRIALDDHATRGDLSAHLEWLKLNVPPGGRVYFFFSGHGAPDASQGTPYLLPYDGNPAAVDQTALPLEQVMRTLSESKAGEVLAIVDSCYSGAGGRSVLPAGARPIVRMKEAAPAAQVALFAASSGSQISGPSAEGNGGLFTKYLIEGIGSGSADVDGDGQITLNELKSWVGPRVEREAKRASRAQVPSLSLGNKVDPQSFVVTSLSK